MSFTPGPPVTATVQSLYDGTIDSGPIDVPAGATGIQISGQLNDQDIANANLKIDLGILISYDGVNFTPDGLGKWVGNTPGKDGVTPIPPLFMRSYAQSGNAPTQIKTRVVPHQLTSVGTQVLFS